jgi:hypothetical protein
MDERQRLTDLKSSIADEKRRTTSECVGFYTPRATDEDGVRARKFN